MSVSGYRSQEEVPVSRHRVQESGCRVGERPPVATVGASMNHVRDRALLSGGGGGGESCCRALAVAALRERSGVGFSAFFTLVREKGEKRIERNMRGVRGVISNLDDFF